MAEPLFLLTPAQMRRIRPRFPLSHGVPRVDDRRVISGIIYVIRQGPQWRDAPPAYGPHKTLHNRFVRWSRMGVFDRILAALAAEPSAPDGGQPAQRGAFPCCIGRTKGRLNSKLHAVCDGQGRPPARPRVDADRGYNSDHFRVELVAKGIDPWISRTRSRKAELPYDQALYKQRHRIEIMFGRLRNWRRIATRYDRCATTFFGAITLAAIVTFRLGQ